jgi:Signal transduction histidine kinase regulating C4-dicarboxylate transport system
MNLTDIRAHDNCDGDVSRIATAAELSARFAHELNEPLMCVLANAQAAEHWLTANPPNLEEANASIRRILRDARAVNETMQHIHALFNRESLDKKAVSIPAIVGEAVRLVHEDPNKREVPIDLYVDEHLPKACVDPIQIRRVFVNLISNAIEAMEDSRIPLVTVRATISDQNEMCIEVIDNGPGVDDTETIFDAFVTTREKGLGIGLAVSRSIIEAHDGQLWAENNSGGGATFSVALPLSSGSRTPVRDQVSTSDSGRQSFAWKSQL